MRARQDAAHQVHCGHRQGNILQAQFLDDLRRMAMPEGRKGPDHVGAFCMVRAGISLRSRFGGADLHFDDDRRRRIDQIGLDQRQQSQVAGGGVAAHAADVTCACQVGAVQFRQAVNEFA